MKGLLICSLFVLTSISCTLGVQTGDLSIPVQGDYSISEIGTDYAVFDWTTLVNEDYFGLTVYRHVRLVREWDDMQTVTVGYMMEHQQELQNEGYYIPSESVVQAGLGQEWSVSPTGDPDNTEPVFAELFQAGTDQVRITGLEPGIWYILAQNTRLIPPPFFRARPVYLIFKTDSSIPAE